MIVKTQPKSYPAYSYPVLDTYWNKNGDSANLAAHKCANFYGVNNPKGTYYRVYHGGGTITYENGFDRFNHCNHTKDRLRIFFGHPSYIDYSSTQIRFLTGPGVTPQLPPSPSEVDVTASMRRAAWAEIEPQLNTGFSLTNFLWELKDIPRLFKDVRHWINRIKRFKLPISTKTAADLHLTYSFVISPLISDFHAIYNDLLNTEKRVNEFIAKGREPESYHYTQVLDETRSVGVNTRRGYIVSGTKLRYNATARLRYQYRKPSAFEGFKRVMGLRITPEAVWNGIPFSFLVDYVIKVGKFLAQFDNDPHLTVEILDYCDTIKSVNYRSEVVDRSSPPHPSGQVYLYDAMDGEELWTWESTRYQRTPGEPDTGLALPVFDSVSMRELVILAALAHT